MLHHLNMSEGLLRTLESTMKIPTLEVLTLDPFPLSVDSAESLAALLFKEHIRYLKLSISGRDNCHPKIISAIFHAVSVGKLERFEFVSNDVVVQTSIQIFNSSAFF